MSHRCFLWSRKLLKTWDFFPVKLNLIKMRLLRTSHHQPFLWFGVGGRWQVSLHCGQAVSSLSQHSHPWAALCAWHIEKTVLFLVYLWWSLAHLLLNEIWWVSGRGKCRHKCIILYSAIKHSLINSRLWGFCFSQWGGSCWREVKSLSSQQKNAKGQIKFC